MEEGDAEILWLGVVAKDFEWETSGCDRAAAALNHTFPHHTEDRIGFLRLSCPEIYGERWRTLLSFVLAETP